MYKYIYLQSRVGGTIIAFIRGNRTQLIIRYSCSYNIIKLLLYLGGVFIRNGDGGDTSGII